MKKLNFSLSLVAILLGIGFAVVHAAPAKAVDARFATSWFTYNGSGSVTSPASYTEVSGDPSCPGTTSMCAIEASVGSGNKPVITSGLQTEITNALANQTPSAHVSLQND